MIEKLVLGGIWTGDLPIFNPDALISAPSRQAGQEGHAIQSPKSRYNISMDIIYRQLPSGGGWSCLSRGFVSKWKSHCD